MDRGDLNDVQHLTARVAALELLAKLLIAGNAGRTSNPVATRDAELGALKASAQMLNWPIDPASGAIWNEMFLTIERLYREARSGFEGDPSEA